MPLKIENLDALKTFLHNEQLPESSEKVIDNNKQCLFCHRSTTLIGIVEEDETFQFYGLCVRHGRHVKGLMPKIQARLEELAAVNKAS